MGIQLNENHLRYMNIGRKYWAAKLDSLNSNQQNASKEYLENLSKYIKDGVGMHICGPNGSGKTHLSSVLCKEVWRQYRVSSYMVTGPEFKAAMVKDMPASEGSEELARDRIFNVRFLVIDDMGKEYRAQSGYVENSYNEVIRDRSRKGLVTSLTTNIVGWTKFSALYGPSLTSLVKEHMVPVMLDGEDLRVKKGDDLLERWKNGKR